MFLSYQELSSGTGLPLSISTQGRSQWAVSQPPSIPVNIALFVHTGVLPAAEMLRELFWAGQSLVLRAPNVGMGTSHPSPKWPCRTLLTRLLALHTETSFSPCLLPNCSVFHEKLQETSPRRTVMISEPAGQEISFLPCPGQPLLAGTEGLGDVCCRLRVFGSPGGFGCEDRT